MGKAALAGQPGILSVHSGWLGRKEVNRVLYDPGRISVEQMEKLLRKSGTYIQAMSGQDQEQNAPGKGIRGNQVVRPR